jgi:hypothetical protein
MDSANSQAKQEHRRPCLDCRAAQAVRRAKSNYEGSGRFDKGCMRRNRGPPHFGRPAPLADLSSLPVGGSLSLSGLAHQLHR